jgi:hypothetical protein
MKNVLDLLALASAMPLFGPLFGCWFVIVYSVAGATSREALEVFAVLYALACLYVIDQAIRQKLSRTMMVIFGVVSLVIPIYFFLGR